MLEGLRRLVLVMLGLFVFKHVACVIIEIFFGDFTHYLHELFEIRITLEEQVLRTTELKTENEIRKLDYLNKSELLLIKHTIMRNRERSEECLRRTTMLYKHLYKDSMVVEHFQVRHLLKEQEFNYNYYCRLNVHYLTDEGVFQDCAISLKEIDDKIRELDSVEEI